MTHIVTEACIQCKHTECVDVCPVDCFRETPLMLVIDPDECIDCAVCIAECPVNAILPENDLPAEQKSFIALNARLSKNSPAIVKSKAPLPSAQAWRSIPGKALLVESGSSPSSELAIPKDVYRRLASAVALPQSEWEHLLVDTDPMVRFLAVSRHDFDPDREQLIRGLADANASVRRVFLTKAGSHLLESDVDALLDDPSPSVRLELVRARSSNLTPDQREKALCDDEVEVRLSIMSAPDFQPTERQFSRALETGSPVEGRAMLARLNAVLIPRARTHASALVRAAAYGYEGMDLSPREMMAGLSDPDLEVRRSVVTRQEFKPSPDQFAALVALGNPGIIDVICGKADQACIDAALCLKDTSAVAQVVAKANAITTLQLRRCLADERREIALASLQRLGRKLTASQLAVCLQSPHDEVRQRAVELFGPERMSQCVLEQCLADSREKLRSLTVGCAEVKLSAEQLARALEDRAASVRLAAANRPDFRPSVEQFERGCIDTSCKVREVFAARFKATGRRVTVRTDHAGKADQGGNVRRLHEVLREVAETSTWTARKHQLKRELEALLSELNYIHFTVNSRRAWFTKFGEHGLVDVPADKRGPLQPLRGKKAHIVCLGTAPYTTVYFAATANPLLSDL